MLGRVSFATGARVYLERNAATELSTASMELMKSAAMVGSSSNQYFNKISVITVNIRLFGGYLIDG